MKNEQKRSFFREMGQGSECENRRGLGWGYVNGEKKQKKKKCSRSEDPKWQDGHVLTPDHMITL
jgi:hypothetical protein